jgi:hypothetical protein
VVPLELLTGKKAFCVDSLKRSLVFYYGTTVQGIRYFSRLLHGLGTIGKPPGRTDRVQNLCAAASVGNLIDGELDRATTSWQRAS